MYVEITIVSYVKSDIYILYVWLQTMTPYPRSFVLNVPLANSFISLLRGVLQQVNHSTQTRNGRIGRGNMENEAPWIRAAVFWGLKIFNFLLIPWVNTWRHLRLQLGRYWSDLGSESTVDSRGIRNPSGTLNSSDRTFFMEVVIARSSVEVKRTVRVKNYFELIKCPI